MWVFLQRFPFDSFCLIVSYVSRTAPRRRGLQVLRILDTYAFLGPKRIERSQLCPFSDYQMLFCPVQCLAQAPAWVFLQKSAGRSCGKIKECITFSIFTHKSGLKMYYILKNVIHCITKYFFLIFHKSCRKLFILDIPPAVFLKFSR